MLDKIFNKSSIWRRVLPALTFIFGLMLLVVAFYDSGASKNVVAPHESTAKARYTVAKRVLADLFEDKNTTGKQWNILAEEFYDIYAEYKTWPNRPAALFRSALALEAQAKISEDEDDFELAVKRYLKLVHEFHTSQLADDALLQAAKIYVNDLKNNEKALKLLSLMRSTLPKGDMYKEGMALEKTLNNKSHVSKNRPNYTALTQVSWTTLDANTVQITVALDKNTTWHIAKSKNKNSQLLLTMDNTLPAQGVHRGARVKNSVLKQLAIIHPKQGSTALELDFKTLANYKTKIEKNPFRIVLTATATTPQKEQKRQIAVASAAPAKKQAEKQPPVKPSSWQVKAQNPAPKIEKVPAQKQQKVVVSPTVNPKKEKNNQPSPKVVAEKTKQKTSESPKQPTAAELSNRVHKANTDNMAMQLGLGVQTVFIDIGHGGRDPGAIGNGIVERDIVLDTGLRLGKILKSFGLKVVYSRTADKSVPLSSRPVRANDSAADLFVSIHINANKDSRINGFETYYLNFAKNTQAAQTAALENATSDRKLGDMQSLLAKVMLNVRTTESSDLASAVQRATMVQLKNGGFVTKNGGTRSAPFHVLIGTNMPAILVELGYCSNKNEAGKLKQSKYRQALAQGIAKGIVAYKNHLEKGQDKHFALTTNNDDAM